MAAVLALGPGAVLSHRSAAALWQLRPSASATTDVTVAAAGRRSRKLIRVHCTTHLPDDDVDTFDAIPVTSVARTLIDFAAVAYQETLIKAIEGRRGESAST